MTTAMILRARSSRPPAAAAAHGHPFDMPVLRSYPKAIAADTADGVLTNHLCESNVHTNLEYMDLESDRYETLPKRNIYGSNLTSPSRNPTVQPE